MTDRTMTLVNAHLMGKHIEEWAEFPNLRPKTVGVFRKNTALAAAAVFGPGYKDEETINYLDLQLDELGPNIVIPKKADLDAKPPEDEPYPLPSFYASLIFKTLPAFDDSERETVRLSRIADYAFGKCQ